MSETTPDPIVSLTVAAAHQLGYSCRVAARDDVVLSGPSGNLRVGLANLRRMAADEPRERWPALVADYIGTGLIELDVADDPLDTDDFAMMRGLLRTRLYSADAAGADVVRREIAPGLVQRVLIDRVHTMAPVTATMARDWPVGEAELFALAEANTRGDGPLDLVTHGFEQPNAERVDIAMLCGLSDYITAHARWLGEDYPVAGPAGAVFVVPSQRHIYAYPVTDTKAVRATTLLAQLAALEYTRRPWPVSQDVYWWRDGRIERAAVIDYAAEQLRIHPTEEFVAALDRLRS
ncbi:hypothetical protein [Nocardia bovistercoris]|uniref:Uncharacterized protein n=1 Tax=Nocardia bovistercoris TaxID=2785916 RepID=A0A931N628_9NOCA|nr:hypothetical protein [Nocardia bovistercoris]MBH0780051.1 hypothetical protein [Nocardia bovistercoris]